MSIARLSLIAATLLAAAGSHADGTFYDLQEGTSLAYTSRISIDAGLDVGGATSATVASRYTVLRSARGKVTLFGDDRIAEAEGETSDDRDLRATFYTFEADTASGAAGEPVGLLTSPAPGWNQALHFPDIAPEGDEVAMELPMLGFQTAASVTRETRDGAIIYSVEAKPNEELVRSGLEVVSLRSRIEYDTARNSVTELGTQFSAILQREDGSTTPLNYVLHSTRTAQEELPQERLAELQKDVTAALPLISKVNSTLMDAGADYDELNKALEAYAGEHPSSPVTPTLKALGKELVTAATLRRNQESIRTGEAAPDFSATTLDGTELKLSDLRGKVVLIDFWATWCPPCIMEMPGLLAMHNELHEKGFAIVGVSADRDAETLKRFVDGMNIPWPQILEPEPKPGTVQFQYGVFSYPTLILLDKKGTIRHINVHGPELQQAIESLLGEDAA